ncbi:hypothetical protein LTR78_002447 [Recurvomyces mirabilis]|uniref:DUF7730 domain-containing protein n=1 Tax=Recurvomyces mirabilis TaxID=574656 RepID=A0AAE0WTG9_9PEZI|nr:hypothetical protein LTR78_002447 [Recurvomyces mirabilis]KAK5157376.1 hypothetical protein LTS14_004141 [Recurvomyces mirabilis]
MSPLKATVHRADAHKTKGSFVVRRLQASPPEKDQSRLLALPPELRNKIYELVFAGVTVVFRTGILTGTVETRSMPTRSSYDRRPRTDEAREVPEWRAITNPQPTKNMRVLQCLLLVNRQLHHEATSIMYGSCKFFFHPTNLVHRFLENAGKANLHNITTMRLEHVTKAYGSTSQDKHMKEKADRGLDNICVRLAQNLPKLTTLELGIQLKELPDHIVPHFGEPDRTFTVKSYVSRPWFQALSNFSKLKKLENGKVTIRTLSNSEMISMFYCDLNIVDALPPFNPALGPSRERQHEEIQERWGHYYLSLHQSIGDAVRDTILRKPEHEVWAAHVQKLEQYRAFCWAPQDPITATLESVEYKMFKLQYDERYRYL